MVKKTFLFRLLLDFTAAGLLLAALAYYWLDNVAHELFGTGVFLLVVVHNGFNRRWYARLAGAARAPRPPPQRIDLVLTFGLLAAMLVLLVTSLMISRTVFGFLRLEGGFTARQIHTLAAYWSVVIVSVHLGIRWQRVMHAASEALHLRPGHRLRTAVLRMAAVAIAACGVHSSFVMGVGGKLSREMSLDGWDFSASTPAFFLHWLAIAGLYVFLAHHAWCWVGRIRRAPHPATP